MIIAYLLNQYPLPSTTFIRREIRAIEAMGITVQRFAAREGPHALIDPQDLEDAGRTDYLLLTPKLTLLADVLRLAVASPNRFARTLKLALTLSRRSKRGLVAHLAYFVEACTLLRRCRKKNVEHIHAHFSTNPAAIASLCHELGGPPYSFTVHGPHEFDAPELLSLDLKAAKAKFVAAISHFTRSQLYRWIPREHWHKINIIRCGVSDRFLSLGPTPVPDTHRLLSIGRLSEQKGQLVLVDAVRLLLDRGVKVQVDLVGGGELEPLIRQQIVDARLEDHVRLLGWKNETEIIDLLRETRALVLPSFAEGLPVVIMEAFALGRPVISTYIAGIPELVRPGETGWLVPAGDVAGLADAVEACLDTPVSRLTAMGEARAGAVREQHDAEREARKLLALIRGEPDAEGTSSMTNVAAARVPASAR